MTRRPAQPMPRQSPQGDLFRPGDRPTASTQASPPAPAGRAISRTVRPHRGYLHAIRGLQSRDQVLLVLLDEHGTLTTSQIAGILFDRATTAERRLYRLRAADWVDCFSPIRAGARLETHWVLGSFGARWAANHDSRTPPTPRALRERNEAIAASSHLIHGDGQRGFFIDLLHHARTHSRTRLSRWWSPARTAAALGQRVHPDGHGVWDTWDRGDTRDGRGADVGHPHQEADHDEPHVEAHGPPAQRRQVGFYLEYDTGSETLDRLIGKIEPYRRLRRDGGPDYALLIHLPSAARETNLHRALNGEAPHLGFALTTTNPDTLAAHRAGPAGQVWRLAGNGRRRHRLADIPSHPGRPGPYHPGPPTPDDDPLCLLGPVASPR